MRGANSRGFGRPIRWLAKEASGAAAIEFALIATVLVALFGGAVDLIDEQTRRREVDRVAVEVAEAVARCPDSDCVRQNIQVLIEKRDAILGETPGGVLGVAEVTRTGNLIIVLQGSMTYLPDDLKTEALAVLEDKDVGIAVLLSYQYDPLVGLFPESSKTIRRYAVALRAKDIKMI